MLGTGDYQPGPIRITFLVLRPDGAVVERPHADLWLATNVDSPPLGRTTARLESITPDGFDARIDLTITDEGPMAQAIVVISAIPRAR